MDATDDPGYLRDLAAAVGEFKARFSEFLELHEENTEFMRGVLPAVFPKEGVSAKDVRAARSATSQAAGRVLYAPALTGVKINVQGAGTIDPIAAWMSVAQPKPVLEPVNVLDGCDQIIGRLEGLARKAEAEAPPELGVRAMHPLIWGAAGGLWRSGHHREAVAGAAQALIDNVKTLTDRRDVADMSIWQQAFSAGAPGAGKPRLRWPGDPSDATVRSMQDGLRQFAPGAQMTIRNSAAHGTEQMPEQEALERLAVLSLLARWVDECEVVAGG